MGLFMVTLIWAEDCCYIAVLGLPPPLLGFYLELAEAHFILVGSYADPAPICIISFLEEVLDVAVKL